MPLEYGAILLMEWMRKHSVGLGVVKLGTGILEKKIRHIFRGEAPSLFEACCIEYFTDGEVPSHSWLLHPRARKKWDAVLNAKHGTGANGTQGDRASVADKIQKKVFTDPKFAAFVALAEKWGVMRQRDMFLRGYKAALFAECSGRADWKKRKWNVTVYPAAVDEGATDEEVEEARRDHAKRKRQVTAWQHGTPIDE